MISHLSPVLLQFTIDRSLNSLIALIGFRLRMKVLSFHSIGTGSGNFSIDFDEAACR